MGKQCKQEIWKDILGFETRYQISNLGRVKSLIRTFTKKDGVKMTIGGKLLTIQESEYLKVSFSECGNTNTFTIHRLIAIAFIPNPKNKPQVNHIDGNKHNNDIQNLEWCTSRENVIHAIDSGLMNGRLKGSKNHFSKLNEVEVLYIRKNFNHTNISMKELTSKFNIKKATLYRIINRTAWKHI